MRVTFKFKRWLCVVSAQINLLLAIKLAVIINRRKLNNLKLYARVKEFKYAINSR